VAEVGGSCLRTDSVQQFVLAPRTAKTADRRPDVGLRRIQRRRSPAGEIKPQIVRHGARVRFVKFAQSIETFAHFDVVAKRNIGIAKQIAQPVEFLIAKTSKRKSTQFLLRLLAMKDMADVDQDMP